MNAVPLWKYTDISGDGRTQKQFMVVDPPNGIHQVHPRIHLEHKSAGSSCEHRTNNNGVVMDRQANHSGLRKVMQQPPRGLNASERRDTHVHTDHIDRHEAHDRKCRLIAADYRDNFNIRISLQRRAQGSAVLLMRISEQHADIHNASLQST